ncbi:hypothetical protein K227x_19920 [Rubripirellula lacrimiformis]|uniref:Uncharacterized protein n=1 Tax=Rubripirellula lacrimiformis TaxID=1930273 RepID=A0A517N9D5_9BACT|nr:hypothetical protein K227x_19920 [Rubripirellula lacrimiformis]
MNRSAESCDGVNGPAKIDGIHNVDDRPFAPNFNAPRLQRPPPSTFNLAEDGGWWIQARYARASRNAWGNLDGFPLRLTHAIVESPSTIVSPLRWIT